MEREGATQRVRRGLELARDCVKTGETPQALAHLHSIGIEVDEMTGSPEWAEYQLIYAGCLPRRDPDTDYAYRDALTRISQLTERHPMLEMRGHDDYGKYLAGRKIFSKATEESETARRIADELNQPDDAARLHLRVIGLDLEEQGSPLHSAFQNLRKAARDDGYTHTEEIETWIAYTSELNQIGGRLLAARKSGEASVDYFRGKLSEVRRRLREVVS